MNDKMMGRKYTPCPCGSKFCTNNPSNHKERTFIKRTTKRRERAAWKREWVA